MRIRVALLAFAALPLVSSCGGNPAPHAGQPTVQGQSMAAMLSDVVAVRTFVYGSGSQADAEKAATDLVAWSQRMLELFPPGQASTEYVDMSPDRLKVAPAAMDAGLGIAADRCAHGQSHGDRQSAGANRARRVRRLPLERIALSPGRAMWGRRV